jgi:flagellar hook-length control protein FliK
VTKLESLADKKHAKASAKSSEAGVDSLNEKDGDPSRVFFAQSFGKNIQNGKKGPVADSVPKTLKTDGQDTSSTSPAMTFDSRKVTDGELARKFSANTEDAGKAMMDRKGEADKAAEKELTGSFAKVLKETSGSAKSSDESSITRPLSATDLYGKVADLKTASTASASDKTLPAYVTDQVAKQISKAVKNGDTEIRFHIKPPDMGKVQLSIASTKDGLKIHIMAEHQSTRDMIMSQTSDLKTLLADQGIRLEKIDVGLSGDFGQSLAQARQETDNSGRERKNKEKPAFQIDGIAENSVGTPETVPLRYTRGNLDLVA